MELRCLQSECVSSEIVVEMCLDHRSFPMSFSLGGSFQLIKWLGCFFFNFFFLWSKLIGLYFTDLERGEELQWVRIGILAF